MKKVLILIAILCAFIISSAQSVLKQSDLALQDINRRGEVYFSFPLADRSQLQFLSRIISISNISGNTVYAYANQKEFSDFSNYKFDYSVLTPPSELKPVKMSNSLNEVLSWNAYPTYPAYETMMQQFASDYPQICKLITIATLNSGRKILALRISDNVNVEENEPEFLYTSSIHGDETTGYILMLHLADSLLRGYGTSDRITNIVNNFDVVICPLANPDGTYAAGNTTINGATRYNANSVDLNRNYPDPEPLDPGNLNYNHLHPDGNAWQPETVAFMDFADQNSFTMGANFHGGFEIVNYPWDTWAKLAPDDAWWRLVSREYADTVHKYAPWNYMNELDNGITNGYAWYRITGGRQDYMNYFQYCREATIEISDTKLVSASQLLAHWNYNCRSFLNFIEQAGYGLRGLVTDAQTGTPLNARIFISGFDKDSSQVYTDPQVGDYHRLLKGGSYNVTYSANRYLSQTIPLQVTDRQTMVLNVQLTAGSQGTNISEENLQSGISVYPNPVIGGKFVLESLNQIQAFKISDAVGKIVNSSKPLTNKFSVESNWPAGIYLLQIEVKDQWISRKIQVIK